MKHGIATILVLTIVLVVMMTRQGDAETTAAPSNRRRLTMATISASLKRMEYAVRGTVVIEADKMAASQKDGAAVKIIYTNIGNPQSVGQQPLTWPRQVVALANLPRHVGIDHPNVHMLFPVDAIARAREILDATGSVGAYSHSQGVPLLRQDVADFITKRDSAGGDTVVVPTHPDDIFLTNGASAAIQMVLTALIAQPERTGIMLPIPQYPIYSATVDLLNGRKVPYYLDEDQDWALNLAELEQSYDQAVASGIDVAALVLINPGNPTGQVLTKDNVRDIVEFCVRKNIVLLADEVYQENVYYGDNTVTEKTMNSSDDNGPTDAVGNGVAACSSFYSCKKAAADLELLDRLELFSFHSISKGVFGECGQRGGYMELSGIDEHVHAELYKLASSGLCSTVTGQILTALMCRGPAPGDVSYESHELEKLQLWQSLKRKSRIVSDGLNAIAGFSCRPAKGSMYCFPAVQMPLGALARAEQLQMSVDTFYCLDLLKATGICVVPASGFGQKEGRHGFRTTFLPDERILRDVVGKIQAHYNDFCAGDYSYTY